MTIEELSENMRFTDNEVIFDKQFYNDVMLKCFINSLLYKKLCQELKNENKKYKDVINKAIKYIDEYRDYQDVHKQVGIDQYEDITEDILFEENIEELLDILRGVK